MLDQIRHEQAAMEAAIPSWEWDEYDDITSSMAQEKMKRMFGGGED